MIIRAYGAWGGTEEIDPATKVIVIHVEHSLGRSSVRGTARVILGFRFVFGLGLGKLQNALEASQKRLAFTSGLGLGL